MHAQKKNLTDRQTAGKSPAVRDKCEQESQELFRVSYPQTFRVECVKRAVDLTQTSSCQPFTVVRVSWYFNTAGGIFRKNQLLGVRGDDDFISHDWSETIDFIAPDQYELPLCNKTASSCFLSISVFLTIVLMFWSCQAQYGIGISAYVKTGDGSNGAEL